MTTTPAKRLSIRDLDRILAFIPYRKGRILLEPFEEPKFTADRDFDEALERAAKTSGQNFRRDNHSIWVILTRTGEVLGLWFTDNNVIIGTKISLENL